MCGIVGVIGDSDAALLILDGLRRLEYRGYDSAGIAVLGKQGLERRRAEGKLNQLGNLLAHEPLAGHVGIGHTRWATHGAPTTSNAHPHADGMTAVVHNGIIENYASLRTRLEKLGAVFESDTDTETIVHLLSHYRRMGLSAEETLAKALGELEGAFALGILFADCPNQLFGARRGSPLAIGYGEGAMYLGSDALALAPLTRRITYLEEGDWVVLSSDTAVIFDANNQKTERPIRITELTGALIGKGNYRHFMEKEIFEQPVVIGDTLHALLNPHTRRLNIPDWPVDARELSRLTLVACGTSYYAGLTAKYWFEALAALPVEVDIASEFRYRRPPLPQGGVTLGVSQSGETADTLAALKFAGTAGQKIMAVVNSAESSIARMSDCSLLTKAGPEIGVASTKAFTTQLAVLLTMALDAGARRGADETLINSVTEALIEVPSRASEILQHAAVLEHIALDLVHAKDVLYLGRGLSYPIALEGALKLKEIAYIHAEGYAAGEMKHGPIALIDEDVPVVVVAPYDELFEKTASSIQEVCARGGQVLLLSDERGVKELAGLTRWSFVMPSMHNMVSPILYALPVQLLAYYTALHKGTDVDQPRNLAKSVTVE